jgi:plastocyanin
VTSDEGKFASPTLKNEDYFEYTFDTIGTFNYHCTIHPGMNGTIIVKPANQVPTI